MICCSSQIAYMDKSQQIIKIKSKGMADLKRMQEQISTCLSVYNVIHRWEQNWYS